MIALRSGPKGARFAPFGLAALALILIPTAVGHQDLAALAAQMTIESERGRPHAAPSRPSTIPVPTLRFQRPIGTQIPEPPPIRLASLGGADITGAIGGRRGRDDDAPYAFPTVERRLKGDFLAARPTEPRPAPPARAPLGSEGTDMPLDLNLSSPGIPAGTAASAEDEIEAALRYVPFPEYDISLSLELHPQIPGDATMDTADADAAQPDISLLTAANDPDPRERTARLFFGDLVGPSLAGIIPWTPGEEPILMVPRGPDNDPKGSTLARLPDAASTDPELSGETIAGKGEVTGDGQRPKSPAERLGLVGKAREKAEKCLANAVYFESRGEAVRGQIAVAQVVLNRAFSGYYPDDVCGVVYQNAHRHLACQFTFACDGIPDVITEAEAWERAQRVARASLDGRVWLPEIGKATHYHAYWVHPWWVRTMRKLSRLGVHTFYRPRRWGDGDDAPAWGSAAATAEIAAKL
jgi:spore germination cell wall hydrolase CwlJ-like protein